MTTAIALDDEPLALKIIENFSSQVDFLKLEKTFNKQSDAQKYLNKFPVDLIFLDIQMPQKNGIDFYKNISQSTKVIFTTAFSDYAVDAFEVNAIDYLVKPFSFERFLKAVEKLKENETKTEQDFLMLRADYKLHKINFEEIILVESLDDYIKIHLKERKTITARQSLKNIQEKLPEKDFVRIHRSYIIPIKEIKSIVNKSIKIGKFIIPIGDKYKYNIQKLITILR
jgi:DNA-binding LytR/AlgR family response regulator